MKNDPLKYSPFRPDLKSQTNTNLSAFGGGVPLHLHTRMMESQAPFQLPQIPKGIDELARHIGATSFENDDATPNEINVNGSTFRFTCEYCGRGFNDQQKYEDHIKTQHPPQQQQTYHCQFCNQTFTSRSDLENHECKPPMYQEYATHQPHRSQGGAYTCNVCGKTFNQRYHLQTHMASHTGNKPFSCMICGKAFARKDVLGVHMKVHSDVKEFQCEVCGARFKQRYHLTRHMNTHLERVDVVCDFCGQVFHRLDRYN